MIKNTEKSTPDYILGLSAYYHDSAAALIYKGKTIAAAQEERFTRKNTMPLFRKKPLNTALKRPVSTWLMWVILYFMTNRY
nr:carbamoyltransferase N-terminal domain-containing protein [sulfur-oxidizing endosymbiont of Gigantopelta aegis]